jgi:Flp pilus assembly protein TadD
VVSPPPARASARARSLVALLLAALAVALYLPVAGNGFVFDDRTFILSELRLRDGLSREGVAWALRDATAAMYVPVARLSHQLDFQLYGAAPAGHHVSSVLLHAANGALLFLALAGLTGALWRSAAAAALFAVHPMNVEAVAWVSSRADLLAAFFGLLTLLAWTRALRRPGPGWRLAAAAAFLLAMLSKGVVMTLPFALLLLDAWPLGRLGPGPPPAPAARRATGAGRGGRIAALVGEKWLLFAVAAALVGVSLSLLKSRSQEISVAAFPLPARAATVLVSYVAYLGKAFWPARLAVVYPHRWGAYPWWQPVAAAAVLCALTAAALAVRRRLPYLAAGWLWFLGTLVPVIGFYQARYYEMADRYAYLPLIGLSVALVWGLGDLARRFRHGTAACATLVAALIVACLPASRAQARHWRDDLALFSHALAVTQDNWVARYSVGLELLKRGARTEAKAQILEALRLRPDYADALNGLGQILLEEGDLPGAAARFSAALAAQPDHAEALSNLGLLAQREGRLAEAESWYRKALRQKAALPQALNNLGVILEATGRGEEALERYRESLRQDPGYSHAYVNLGVALLGRGREEEGLAYLRRALEVEPRDAGAHNDLGVYLEGKGRLAEAEIHYREALRLEPGSEIARRNLARLRARRGSTL